MFDESISNFNSVNNSEAADSSSASTTNATAENRPKIAEIKIARLLVVQCMYHYEMSQSLESTFELAVDLVESWPKGKYFKFHGRKVCRNYLRELLKVSIDHLDSIDNDIAKYLDNGRNLSRIPKTVLAVLRVAAAEIYMKKLDRAIIINEYLNIANYLNHEGDKGFINSVLDKIAIQIGCD